MNWWYITIGNKNAITYKDFFPLIKENKVWVGYMFPAEFKLPNGKTTRQIRGLCKWFTNIDHERRHQMLPLDLGYKYSGHEDMYPKYNNCDAINVDKIHQIPCDYMGVMGVPITFLDKYCPEQFEIIGIANSSRFIGNFECFTIINNRKIYNRILIKKRGDDKICQ